MIVKDLEINEASVRRGAKIEKHIGIFGKVIVTRNFFSVCVPVNMRFEYEDNGSYFENYKKSVEQYLLECEGVSKHWKIQGDEKVINL